MQGTMKAARIYGFEKTSKSRDLLRVDEVPIPEIESGEVLIRVLRAGLNHGDLHMREDAVQYTSRCRPYRFADDHRHDGGEASKRP
jgi:NADPH:quinone reductase-like Zn-dependent oxidoreductase